MDLQQLMQIAAAAFKQGAGDPRVEQLPTQSIIGALKSLLGNGQGGIDIASLVKLASSSGLMEMAQSWLSDGPNASPSVDGIIRMLGQAKLGEFARQLGIDQGAAIGGLREAIPVIVDKASSGGSLLDSLGGVEGMLGMAGKLFGR